MQATWTFMPVVLCLPEYSSGRVAHDQHGSSVPSTMYCIVRPRSSAVGTYGASTLSMSGVIADDRAADCGLRDAVCLSDLCLDPVPAHIGQGYDDRLEQSEDRRPVLIVPGSISAAWIMAQSSVISSLVNPVVLYIRRPVSLG